MLKKYIYKQLFTFFMLLSVVSLFSTLNLNAFAASSYVKTFTVSAYYSPLVGQEHYALGSYEADIRMNGNGTYGADGTPVYIGMIAAPKSYAFGTVMNIPGVGEVTVHDRGGAIREYDGSSGIYDRLDIWMGYGDEGLNAALNWGKRNVDVTVYAEKHDDYNESNIAVASSDVVPIIASQPVDVEVLTPEKKYGVGSDVISMVEFDADYTEPLTLGSSGPEVSSLQNELNSLNFYKGPINGVYDDLTVHAVYKFQQSQGVVLSEDDLGAGVFGPKTRAKMNSIVAMRNETNVRVAAAMVDFSETYPGQSMIASNIKDDDSVFDDDVLVSSELSFGMSNDSVRSLQNFLAYNGYIDASRATAYYGNETKSAVLQFQLDNGIVSSESDLGAGRVGPATKSLINSLS